MGRRGVDREFESDCIPDEGIRVIEYCVVSLLSGSREEGRRVSVRQWDRR